MNRQKLERKTGLTLSEPCSCSDDRNHSQLTFIPKLWHPLTCKLSRQPSWWLMTSNQTKLSQNNVSAGGSALEFTLILMTNTSEDTVTECLCRKMFLERWTAANLTSTTYFERDTFTRWILNLLNNSSCTTFDYILCDYNKSVTFAK